MTLFGSYARIWSAAQGAAVRGSLLVTLSPNCSFDSQRRDTRSKGEATHWRGKACPAHSLSLFNLCYTGDRRGHI